MKYTNQEMTNMLKALDPLLERCDAIGYAAARNARILKTELTEFDKLRDELVVRYGTPNVDADGNETGSVTISPTDEGFAEFAEQLDRFARIEHEPALYRIDYQSTGAHISGTELLETHWMFTDFEEDVDNG